MIFAELDYNEEYAKVHERLVSLLSKNFAHVESGHQGDSYVWIMDGSERVAIDTFTSMKHQVKSAKPGSHVQRVIEVLQSEYKIRVFELPEPEGHEDV